MRQVYLFVALLLTLQSYSIAQQNTNGPIRAADIKAIKVLPDRKILVGGDINYFEDQRVHNLVRLNEDGSLDETFQFKIADDFFIEEIVMLPNGNVAILTESFSSGNLPDYHIFTIDNSGAILNTSNIFRFVNSIVALENNNILVVGGNSYYSQLGYADIIDSNSKVAKRIADFDNIASIAAVDKDKIYIGGDFNTVNNEPRPTLVKMDYDGNIDTSFFFALTTDHQITNLIVQQDGKIIAGTSNNQTMRLGDTYYPGTLRVNADGSIDESFQLPYLRLQSFTIFSNNESLFLQHSNENSELSLVKLNNNGSLNEEFSSIPLNRKHFSYELDFMDNDIVVSQASAKANIYGVAKYSQAGEQRRAFKPALGRFGKIDAADYFNEKIIVGGDFINFNGVKTYGLALLNEDNTLDNSFLFTELDLPVTQLHILSDDEILVMNRMQLFKINSAAVVQNNFQFEKYKYNYISKFAVLNDGKILVTDMRSIYRLKSDGTEDGNFNKIEFETIIRSSDLQKDGKILYINSTIDGDFLQRSHNNGSLDEAFRPENISNNHVFFIKELNNEEMLLGGWFEIFDGSHIPNTFVKLSREGKVVPEFLETQASRNLQKYTTIDAKVSQIDNAILILTTRGRLLGIDTDGNYLNLNLPFENEGITHILPLFQNNNASQNARAKDVSKKILIFRDAATLKEGESFMMEVTLNEQVITSTAEPKLATTFLIYPNPANNTLYIQPTKAAESHTIVLHNNQGKMVESATFQHVGENEPVTMAIDNLSSGIYFVQYKDSNGEVHSGKFMKQ